MTNPIKEYQRKRYEKKTKELRQDPRLQDAINQFLYNDGQNPEYRDYDKMR